MSELRLTNEGIALFESEEGGIYPALPVLCTGLLGGVQVYTGLTHLAVLAQMYQMPDRLEFIKNFRKYCQLTLCFGMGNNASHIN